MTDAWMSHVFRPTPLSRNLMKVQPSSGTIHNHSSERRGFALIMKGGGMKGLGYVGALQELQRFYGFDMYAGTSAGAITAALLAAGYDSQEMLAALMERANLKLALD